MTTFPKPIKKEKTIFGKPRKRSIVKLSPIRKTKAVTKTKAKKKAWDAFSLWVRISNIEDQSPMAEVACYTCGRWKNYKEMSAGHGIGGRNNAVLFDERIVKPQCAGCNIWGRGQYQVFTRKLIAELGLDEYDEIVKHSSDPIQYKVADYEEIEAKYKSKLESLNS